MIRICAYSDGEFICGSGGGGLEMLSVLVSSISCSFRGKMAKITG